VLAEGKKKAPLLDH